MQFAEPDLSVLVKGNEDQLVIYRKRHVSGTNTVVRFAQGVSTGLLGLHLHKIDKATGFQTFLRPGIDYEDAAEIPEYDPALGNCYISVPGVLEIRSTDELRAWMDSRPEVPGVGTDPLL